MLIIIRRTFKYRLYKNRRNKHLHREIDVAGMIWNHCVALQRRYYRLTGEYINKDTLTKFSQIQARGAGDDRPYAT